MMNYYIICDFREDFPSVNGNNRYYNDHPRKDSVIEICNLLKEKGYKCEIFGGVKKLIHYYDNKILMPNGLYINMSDGLNEEYCRMQVPIMAEMLNIFLSGGNSFLVGLANNKYYANCAVEKEGFLVPKSILFDSLYTFYDLDFININYPVILKPNTEGSSIGISEKNICHTYDEARLIYDTLNQKYNEIIMQEYIDGYEVTNMLVGNKGNYVLNEVVMTLKNGKEYYIDTVLSQDDKANKKTIDIIADQKLPKAVIENIKHTTISIFEKLHYKDIIRIDYRVTKDFKVYFIELNTVPRISSTTELGLMCKHAGLTFDEFLCLYVDSIEKRFNHESK